MNKEKEKIKEVVLNVLTQFKFQASQVRQGM